MTEPSQYFKGRTVQEQMNEVIGYVDTRAAEVATTAIASDVAQVHQDMLDADADAAAAAASAAAAAGTLANAVKKTGEASQSIAGDIAVAGTLSGGVVTGTRVTVPDPVNNTDAANKKYVDDADALKANKTYVDAQDALKLNINDVNSYAVGLTGNQNNITGQKGFKGRVTARTELDRSSATASAIDTFDFTDKDGNLIFIQHLLHVGVNSDAMQFRLYSPDGQKWIALQLAVTNDTCSCSVYTNTGRTANILNDGAW